MPNLEKQIRLSCILYVGRSEVHLSGLGPRHRSGAVPTV